MELMQTLKEQALKIVLEAGIPRRELARQTGLGFDWLNSFAQGRLKDPGISRVEKLFAWAKRTLPPPR